MTNPMTLQSDLLALLPEMQRFTDATSEHGSIDAAVVREWIARIKYGHAELAAMARDGERLEWVSKQWGGHRREYCAHVMNRGGTGDLSDIRTFVDAAMANTQENGE